MENKINNFYRVPENNVQEAMGTLQNCHFDVFNAHEAAAKKSERNRHMKGLTILSHAFDYLNAQDTEKA